MLPLDETQTQLGLDQNNMAVPENQFGSTYFFANGTAELDFVELLG